MMKFFKTKTGFFYMATVLILLILAVTLNGCTDSRRAKFGGLGSEFHIEMINCDGSVAREWTSTGKVESEANSDGYFFMDKATGNLIEVTGRVVITKH